VEGDDSPRSHVRRQPTEHLGRVGLKLQHVPSDDGVESRSECELRRITLAERHVRKLGRPLPSDDDRGWSTVDADYAAFRADELGDEQRNVAPARADVENVHPRFDSGLDEQPARDRLDQRRLNGQPP
jgi:hypothetical protein